MKRDRDIVQGMFERGTRDLIQHTELLRRLRDRVVAALIKAKEGEDVIAAEDGDNDSWWREGKRPPWEADPAG